MQAACLRRIDFAPLSAPNALMSCKAAGRCQQPTVSDEHGDDESSCVSKAVPCLAVRVVGEQVERKVILAFPIALQDMEYWRSATARFTSAGRA